MDLSGIILGTLMQKKKKNKTDKVSVLVELTCQWQRQKLNKRANKHIMAAGDKCQEEK